MACVNNAREWTARMVEGQKGKSNTKVFEANPVPDIPGRSLREYDRNLVNSKAFEGVGIGEILHCHLSCNGVQTHETWQAHSEITCK